MPLLILWTIRLAFLFLFIGAPFYTRKLFNIALDAETSGQILFYGVLTALGAFFALWSYWSLFIWIIEHVRIY